MFDDENEYLLKIDLYVKCVDDLAESLNRDIINGKTISSDTVVRLTKMISARTALAGLIDVDESGGGYQ